MLFKTIIVASLPVIGVLAAPAPASTNCTSSTAYGDCTTCPSSSIDFGVTTTTVSLTLTITSTHTYTAVPTSTKCSSTSAAPITAPTSAYGLISARSASPIHLQTWNAAGQRFWLGGTTASYCPQSVAQMGSCPPGNATAFLGTCAMDVLVPGGQQIYVTPGGEIGYTQAHSMSMPAGSNPCPFAYSKPAGSSFGYITLNPSQAFGATGFMACPTDSGYYQVYASIKNAKVPKGDVSKCLGFSALAGDYTGGFAAWQYT